jgi:lactose/L-arabinose transport system permease protein
VVQVPIMIALATVLAVLLNSTLLKARGLMRFAFFAPVVVGEVAYAAVFRLIFSEDLGFVNKAWPPSACPRSRGSPRHRGHGAHHHGRDLALGGYNAIIILSGLQSIPDDVYEAATLDRVSPLRQFFFITLPLLQPVILFCVVLSVIGTMQLFAEPFLITNEGGPGGATETLGPVPLPPGLPVLNFGYASAVAYTIAALAVMISLLNLWVGREKA